MHRSPVWLLLSLIALQSCRDSQPDPNDWAARYAEAHTAIPAQAQMPAEKIDALEVDLVARLSEALKQPLEFKIPPVTLDRAGRYRICGESCDVAIHIVPGSLTLARRSANAKGRGQIVVHARAEIFAPGVIAIEGRRAEHYEIDLAARNDPACAHQALAEAPTAAHGLPFTAVLSALLDVQTGAPRVEIESVEVAAGECAADFIAYRACAGDACPGRERLRLEDTAAGGGPELIKFMGAAVQPWLKRGAQYSLGARLARAFTAACRGEGDCAAGEACEATQIAAGYPDGCKSGKCVTPPVAIKTCRASGAKITSIQDGAARGGRKSAPQ